MQKAVWGAFTVIKTVDLTKTLSQFTGKQIILVFKVVLRVNLSGKSEFGGLMKAPNHLSAEYWQADTALYVITFI